MSPRRAHERRPSTFALQMNDKPPEILTYVSLPVHYGFEGDVHPFEYKNKTVRIYETLTPKKIPSTPALVGEYRIHLEVPVSSMDQYSQVTIEADELIEQIEKLWPYICGEPLRPILVQMSLDTTPDGWISNQKPVQREMNIRMTGGIYCEVEIVQAHWLILPYYPLEHVLIARQQYESFEDVYSSLVDLHYDSMTARSAGGRLFSSAKGLELVTRLIPGTNHRQRHEQLDPNVRGRLRRTINQLHDISNNRFNVRHVVSDSSGPILHPKASGKELADFTHDCDLLMRHQICKRLGIPMVQFQKARPSESKTD